jgi:hypothetical protein
MQWQSGHELMTQQTIGHHSAIDSEARQMGGEVWIVVAWQTSLPQSYAPKLGLVTINRKYDPAEDCVFDTPSMIDSEA